MVEISVCIALRSSHVNVGSVPNPPCAPPALVVPGRMISKLAPIEANDSSTRALAPSPIATMAITAETPIITPKAVRNERSLFRKSADSAVRRVSRSIMRLSLLPPHGLPVPLGEYQRESARLLGSPPELHILRYLTHE